jgi:hypothetical protein
MALYHSSIGRRLAAMACGVGISALGCSGAGGDAAAEVSASGAASRHEPDFVDGRLLHEEVLTATSLARFYDMGDGEAMVLVEGSVDLDVKHPLDDAPAAHTLPDYFRALFPARTNVVVPDSLIEAQERIDAYQPKRFDMSRAKVADVDAVPSEVVAIDQEKQQAVASGWEFKVTNIDWNADANWFINDLGPGVGGDFGACNRPGAPNTGVFKQCKTNMISTSWMYSGSASPTDISPVDFRATGMTASFETASKLRVEGLYCTNYILFVDCTWDKKYEGTIDVRRWHQEAWLSNGAAEERRARAWSLDGDGQRLHVGIEGLNVDDGTCCDRY